MTNETAKNVTARLSNCSGREALAREILNILIEQTGAREGHLFCVTGERLLCVASTAGTDRVQALQPALDLLLKKEFGSDMLTTVLERATLAPKASGTLAGFEPLFLLGKHAGDTVVAGVAALSQGANLRRSVSRSTMEALASALIESKLAEPLVCAT